jgi:hypothetical protein
VCQLSLLLPMFTSIPWPGSALSCPNHAMLRAFLCVQGVNDSTLPLAHTCFFNLELPEYSKYDYALLIWLQSCDMQLRALCAVSVRSVCV